ncbi:MAG: hypothetical protein GQ574_11945 [Crocinitomix sp.]|nr:hypothetical protein [Crocinitomix sp.]
MEIKLLEQIRTITASNPDIRFYLFGSSLKENVIQNDIDLLVIYKDRETPQMVRDILDKTNLPIDTIFFTVEEELELGFIEEVKAREIL